MAYTRNTLILLAQLAPRIRRHTLRNIDVQYMGMSARYADHVLGLALHSDDAELRALGALLRQDFFGPAGLFPGGKMLWCFGHRESRPSDEGPETLDFAPPAEPVRAAALLS
jgi:hypothetical protein